MEVRTRSMSLPALARSFQHVETTLQLEQPTLPKAGVVLSFSLAKINGIVKSAIIKVEDIRATVVSATAAARKARAEKGSETRADDSALRNLDIAISTGDVIATMVGLSKNLERVSLMAVVDALHEAAPKLANRSSEERRYVRRLASRVIEAEHRFVASRNRFAAEAELLASYLQDGAREIVAEASTYEEFAVGGYEAVPMQAQPDYQALRRSISRRFEKTLARLAE